MISLPSAISVYPNDSCSSRYFLSPPPGLNMMTESPRTNNISDRFLTVYMSE